MKYIIILFTGLLAFSCTNEGDIAEMKLKKRFITQLIRANELTVNMIELETSKSSRLLLFSTSEKSKKFVSWRNRYHRQSTVENLLSYSDSVLTRYVTVEARDEQVSKAIEMYQEHVLNNEDSVNILNLYWYTLYAESAVLDSYVRGLGLGADYFDSMLPTNLTDSTVLPGDTVLVLVNTFSDLKEWHITFDSISCTNEQTGAKIIPRITKIDNFYLLRYIPEKKGKYLIRGPVLFSYGKYEDQLPIGNHFTVE
jgi:hypothetical protein